MTFDTKFIDTLEKNMMREVTEKEISKKENLEMLIAADNLLKKIMDSKHFNYDLKFEAIKNAVSVAQLIRKSWE